MRDACGSVLGAAAACALVATGCGLTLDADPPERQVRPDAGMDGGATDGSPGDGGGGDADDIDAATDAGFGCFGDEECDDGNPCTDDACSSGRCVHSPNTAACDDGVYCNGEDRCAAGDCTDHLGDPCLPDTVCDEGRDACVGCVSNADCPDAMHHPWSRCDYTSKCDRAATRTREVTTYECVDEECSGTTTMEVEDCSRSTAGVVCEGPYGCSDGDCSYETECRETGSAPRTCTVSVCTDGSCTGTDTRTTTVPCTRSTEVEHCGGADDNLCDGVNVCMGGECRFTDSPCGGSLACIDGSTCECDADTDCDIACATLDCGGSGCGCITGGSGLDGLCGCL